MSEKPTEDGTQIAQAAKDLNVTSVTIRRYLTEFKIQTIANQYGINILPNQAIDELIEIRRLKEDGLTNLKILEILEASRQTNTNQATRTITVEGVKIAKAAKDLNLTTVTIRRYLSEFNIETAFDADGSKVLSDEAMDELKMIHRLKEQGLTNAKLLKILEEDRRR